MKVGFVIDIPDKDFMEFLDAHKNKTELDLSGLLDKKKGFVSSWQKNIKTIPIDGMTGTVKEYVDGGTCEIQIIYDDETKSTKEG